MNNETYLQQKKRHENEMNNFEGLFFAFSNQQLEEGLEKVGLLKTDTDKIYSLGGGGFVRKDKAKDLMDMIDRHSMERKELQRDEKKLFDALVYQLGNHEYCITLDPTYALESLGLTRETVDQKILKDAIRKYMETVEN